MTREQEPKIFPEDQEIPVDQETLVKSWIAHAELYKDLQKKAEEAQAFYDRIKETYKDDPENPAVEEAKSAWDKVYTKWQERGEIMNKIFNQLTEESKEKIKKWQEEIKVVEEQIDRAKEELERLKEEGNEELIKTTEEVIKNLEEKLENLRKGIFESPNEK